MLLIKVNPLVRPGEKIPIGGMSRQQFERLVGEGFRLQGFSTPHPPQRCCL